jgi:adenylylsulfate kinase-like enzyme
MVCIALRGLISTDEFYFLIHVTRLLPVLHRPDLIRAHLLSSVSRAHRDLNMRLIGFVAGKVVKHGVIAIASAIAPYDNARKFAQSLVSQHGRFYLVNSSPPHAVCEARDVKGLYAKARAVILKEFTGISDPYEAPADAEITIDTSITSEIEAVSKIIE